MRLDIYCVLFTLQLTKRFGLGAYDQRSEMPRHPCLRLTVIRNPALEPCTSLTSLARYWLIDLCAHFR